MVQNRISCHKLTKAQIELLVAYRDNTPCKKSERVQQAIWQHGYLEVKEIDEAGNRIQARDQVLSISRSGLLALENYVGSNNGVNADPEGRA